MQIYRLCLRNHATNPLDGEGSFRYGGRWSNAETRVAYTSTTPSLATLEFLGWHIDRMDVGMPLTLIVATVPDLVSRDRIARVPADWKNIPAPASTRRLGDKWIQRGASCLLFVPSIHVPKLVRANDENVLINPLHPDFARITIKRIPYSISPRFLSKGTI